MTNASKYAAGLSAIKADKPAPLSDKDTPARQSTLLKGGTKMSHTRIVDFLSEAVNSISNNIGSYVFHPNSDFTRNKKLPADKLLQFLITEGSSSTRNELTEAFDYSPSRPSSQAFIQQRAKLKPEGIQAVFDRFNSSLDELHPKGKYRFLAVDGSTLSFQSDPRRSSNDYFNIQCNSADGCYSVHAVTSYDVDTDLYTDCVLQPIRKKDEFSAFRTIVDRHPLPGDGARLVFLADRGFCSYNDMAHVIERGQFFLFRAKDVDSKGLLHHFGFSESNSFDISVKLIIIRRNSKKMVLPEGYRRFVTKDVSFDYVEYGSSDYYILPLRIIRFELSPDNYEALVTNLPANDFPQDSLKSLYHSRWKVETSYRYLKYTIGLTKFHSSKAVFIHQEIWARLIGYNFTQAVINCAAVEKKEENKYSYQINFSVAVRVCRKFFRSSLAGVPISVIPLLLRELVPVRNDRPPFPRLKTAHFRRPAFFAYRPS